MKRLAVTFTACLLLSLTPGWCQVTWRDDVTRSEKLLESEKYSDAIVLIERALKSMDESATADDKALCIFMLATAYWKTGRSLEAEKLMQQAISIAEKFDGPDSLSVAHMLNNSALIHDEQGKHKEAEAEFKRAIAIKEQKLEPGSASLSKSLQNLGDLFTDENRFAEAETLIKKAISFEEKRGQTEELIVYKTNLAKLYLKQNKDADAKPILTDLLTTVLTKSNADQSVIDDLLFNLAELNMRQKNYSDAMHYYRQCLEVREKRLGSTDISVAKLQNYLGVSLFKLEGHDSEAEALYKKSRVVFEHNPKAKRDLSNSLHNLATLYARQGRLEDAEPYYQQGLKLEEECYGANSTITADTRNDYANLYNLMKKYPEAESQYKQSLTIKEKNLNPNSMSIASTLNNLGELYRNQEKYAEAEQYYKRALEIKEKMGADRQSSLAITLFNLGLMRNSQGRGNEAVALKKRALSLDPKTKGGLER